MRVYDFMCPKGHVEEHFVDGDDVRAVTCNQCGGQATRLPPSARPKLDPISGHFPGATMTWEKNRESHMKKEQKHKDNHGTYWLGKDGDMYKGTTE